MEGVTVVVESAPWWETLIPQVLGTLVGAGVALAGSWWLFRRERGEQYQDDIDGAVARIMEEGERFATARRQYVDLSYRWTLARMLPSSRAEAGPMPEEPLVTSWLITVREAALRARGAEQAVLDLASLAAERVDAAPVRFQTAEVERVGAYLFRWRRRLMTDTDVKTKLQAVVDFAEEKAAIEAHEAGQQFADSPPGPEE